MSDYTRHFSGCLRIGCAYCGARALRSKGNLNDAVHRWQDKRPKRLIMTQLYLNEYTVVELWPQAAPYPDRGAVVLRNRPRKLSKRALVMLQSRVYTL